VTGGHFVVRRLNCDFHKIFAPALLPASQNGLHAAARFFSVFGDFA
jgi:hypothetical protein